MAETKTLAATARSGIGKGAARSVRREGRIPGVIYGGGDPAEPITLDFRDLNKLIYAGHFLTTLFEIDVGGTKQRVIPRDYQLDRVKDLPLHVDFLRLKPGASLRVEVPVHFLNQDTCPGVKKGGSINIVRHSIEMRVPADDIPEAVIADLAELDINDSLHLTALPLPAGCKPTQRERDFTIVTLAPPVVVPEDAAAAAAAAAPAKGAKGAPAAKAAPAAAAAAPAKKK
ncbi:MAG: 50S ribosomal protein L25/general stress protein Ctc [Methylocella sp.]